MEVGGDCLKGISKQIKGGSFFIDELNNKTVMTPEDFTAEQKMIAKTTEDFVEKEVLPVLDEIEHHDFEHSTRLLKKAGELGLLSADIAEEHGGLGLDKISSALITEKMALAGGFAISHMGHVGIGSLPIVLFGNPQQHEKYLPKLASGEFIAAYALTEPESGSDALAAKTTANLNEAGTHYILNGEKQWITNAGFADVFVVYAKVNREHFTAFIVERSFYGVSVGNEEKKMGIKSSSTRTLILEDVHVPIENVLGEIGRGHVIAFNILNIGRYKLGVSATGTAKRALELALKYSNERKQFQQSLSSFNLTKDKVASMATSIYAAESMNYRTVGLFDNRFKECSDEQMKDGKWIASVIAEYAMECSICKVFSSEALDYIADEALQLHGGYGFMAEYEIERIYRDSRINRIFEGTNEINRLIIPTTYLKKSLKGELSKVPDVQNFQKELIHLDKSKVGLVPLEKEKHLLNIAKKLALLVFSISTERFGSNLEKEQELLVKLADIAILIYGMESVIVRTDKTLVRIDILNTNQKILYTEIFCQESFSKIEDEVKNILFASIEENYAVQLCNIISNLSNIPQYNLVKKKREAAKFLIESEKYSV